MKRRKSERNVVLRKRQKKRRGIPLVSYLRLLEMVDCDHLEKNYIIKKNLVNIAKITTIDTLHFLFTQKMLYEIRRKYPRWTAEKGNYCIGMSDDIDSLFSSAILRFMFQYDVTHFYDFKNLYTTQETNQEIIYVDVALEKGKCWDNHVTMFHERDEANPDSANINNIMRIHRENYGQKYAMGTHLQILSFYDLIDYFEWTDQQKMILWGIDASYKGHFSPHEGFRQAHHNYIRLLRLRKIADVLEKFNEKDFIGIQKKYGLYQKIQINKDGFLETEIKLDELQEIFPMFDLSLPNKKFHLKREFHSMEGKIPQGRMKREKIFSMALTGKNYLNFSMEAKNESVCI